MNKGKHIKIKDYFTWSNIKKSLKFQFLLSTIIGGIINCFYFKEYILKSEPFNGKKTVVVIVSLAFILSIVLVISWFPKTAHYIGICLIVTYVIDIIVSIFFVAYIGLLHFLKYVNAVALLIILTILSLSLFIGLAIVFFKRIVDSTFLQLLAIGSFIFLFSIPVIFIVIKLQTLAVAVGGFIAFMTHFFLKQLIPYIFSSTYSEIHNSSNINLKYELNSNGKIILGLIDLLFAYTALAYGIAMHITNRYLVNIRLRIKDKSLIKTVKKIYGENVIPQMDLGTVNYWTVKANIILLNSFTLIMLSEIVISMVIFAGIYRNANRSIFNTIVEPVKIEKTINTHSNR